jgi:hypothetical protein
MPKNETKSDELAVKKTQPVRRSMTGASKVWNYDRF